MAVKIPKWIADKWFPKNGPGEKEDQAACIMQAVAVISPNTNKFTDRPSCVATPLTDHMISLNDRLSSNRARKRLVKHAPRLLETSGKSTKLAKIGKKWLLDYVKKNKIPSYNKIPMKPGNNWYFDQKVVDFEAISGKLDITKGQLRYLAGVLESIDEAIYINVLGEPRDSYMYGIDEESELKVVAEWDKALNVILPDNEHIKPNWEALRPFVENHKQNIRIVG